MSNEIKIILENDGNTDIEDFLGECKYLILLTEDGISKAARLDNRGVWVIEEEE